MKGISKKTYLNRKWNVNNNTGDIQLQHTFPAFLIKRAAPEKEQLFLYPVRDIAFDSY